MIFEDMYRQSGRIGAALNASSVRNEVIVNNLANNDVPGYKAKIVDFEASMQEALDKYERTRELDLTDVKPTVRFFDENYNYRIDKNNVDVELEMVKLYENSIKYDALINCLQSNSKRLSLALTGR
jgi:flagellar basal-body rod protein FlgB